MFWTLSTSFVLLAALVLIFVTLWVLRHTQQAVAALIANQDRLAHNQQMLADTQQLEAKAITDVTDVLADHETALAALGYRRPSATAGPTPVVEGVNGT